MGLALKSKLDFVLSMNGNSCVYIVYVWWMYMHGAFMGPGFCKIKYGLRAIKDYCNFIYFLSIENFEDYVIQDEAHRSGEAQNLEDSM